MPAGPIVLVFAVVFAVVVGAFWLFVQRPEQKSTEALRRRLKGELEDAEEDADALVERQPKRDRRRIEGLAASAGGGVLRYLAVQIERANMDMPPGRLLGIAVVVGALGAVLLGTMSRLWVVTVPLGLAAGWLPIAWVRFMAERRVRKFEEQFPEAIELIARALRAGHAMTTGLALVAEELPDPVGGEFRLVYDRQNFGMSMPDALRLFAERVPLIDARFFVTAVLTQRESGGNLAEILDNLGDVIRQRFRVKRQIRVVTAHARLTGWVLVLMPVVIALAMVVVAPDHILTLVNDPLGIQMAVAAVGLWVVGYLAIRKLTDVEY
ncbi:MAG: type II secretion system F family protein [Vicinamibacteraceae bacterium]